MSTWGMQRQKLAYHGVIAADRCERDSGTHHTFFNGRFQLWRVVRRAATHEHGH